MNDRLRSLILSECVLVNVFRRGVTQPEPCILDDYHGSQSCIRRIWGSRDNRDKEPTTAIHFTSDKRIR